MPTARRWMNCGSSSVSIRARARQGFTPSETAFAIFALRDGVLDTLDHAGHVEYGDSVAFSKLVDGLGLITLRRPRSGYRALALHRRARRAPP